MAFTHADITLNGSTPLSTTRIPVLHVIIHNPTGNATIYVGDSRLSATSYGNSFTAGVQREIGPFSGAAPLNLNEVYVRGTDAQVVHICYVTP